MTNYLLLALKGCAMGMADVIPGVSGGTIAFISGIYTELIESIKNWAARRCGCWPHCVCGSSGVRSTEISWRRFSSEFS